MSSIETLNQRYKIVNRISSGPGGTIYLCIDQVLGLSRIIKESKKNHLKEYGEFDTLKNLHHIGLPQIYDVFEDESHNYIVIEHIEGVDLKKKVEEKKIFQLEEAIPAIRQLLLVIRYLHTIRPNPVVHGDIKPENIIIDGERTVLIDFASINNQKGTSYFVAPERLIGIKKNVQSDIYSIGLIIYYMLTGQIKKLYQTNDHLIENDEINRIIDKCTRKNPNERYKNVGFIMSDLERIHLQKKADYHGKTKIISIHGNTNLSNELAHVIAESFKKKTLLIDTNIFNSDIDLWLPKNKCKLYLQDYLFEEKNKIYQTHYRSNLFILPCRADLESYENFNPNLLEQILSGLTRDFEVIIINCTDFIYDALCIKSIFMSDAVIYTIEKGVSDIRKYNAVINFLGNRQNISKERFMFVQFNSNLESIRKSLCSKAVEASWLTDIPYSRKRNILNTIAGNYATKMETKIRRKYIKLVKMLNI